MERLVPNGFEEMGASVRMSLGAVVGDGVDILTSHQYGGNCNDGWWWLVGNWVMGEMDMGVLKGLWWEVGVDWIGFGGNGVSVGRANGCFEWG